RSIFTRMIGRLLKVELEKSLKTFPVVALLGPRQVGKTTLAHTFALQAEKPAVYLDLERPSDLAKLADPELYLRQQAGKLVILDEVASDGPMKNRDQLWLRGGFPDSFLAASETASWSWREQFISTYLERDIPQLGPRIAATQLRRFWTMLAHHQGCLLNASTL